jgi:DNA-binding MarR family transcriptional regulator
VNDELQPPANNAPEADTTPAIRDRWVSAHIIQMGTLLRRSAHATYGRALELSKVEWRILSLVGEKPGLSLHELAAEMSYDKGQLSRVIKGMIEGGILERGGRPDRRGAFLDVTEAGRALYARLCQFLVARNIALLDGIPDNDLAAFWRVMDALITNARALAAESAGSEGGEAAGNEA